MVDFKRNKLVDLFLGPGEDGPALEVNSKDGERVPVIEGAKTVGVNSPEEAIALIDAALDSRARSLAQGGLNQIAHTILQVHVATVSAWRELVFVFLFSRIFSHLMQSFVHPTRYSFDRRLEIRCRRMVC